MKPTAYTYEADEHCDGCAEERFGRCEISGDIACVAGKDCDHAPATDREGNEVGACFESHSPCGLWCGTCGGEIVEEWHEDLEPGAECEDCGYVADCVAEDR